MRLPRFGIRTMMVSVVATGLILGAMVNTWVMAALCFLFIPSLILLGFIHWDILR